MKVGVLIRYKKADISAELAEAKAMGFDVCQLTAWDMNILTEENAMKLKSDCEQIGITISTFWCGWSGSKFWNFTEGPATLGIVPPEHRAVRVADLKRGSDFAKMLGVDQVATHAGFLPENMTDAEFIPVLSAIKEIAEHCKGNSQKFLFETGQETPTTLRRTIDDVGTGNLGVNLDPANLIIYGKGNPVDALDLIGPFVRNVHGKDAVYPVDGRHGGKEKRLGDGKVNYPAFIARLKEFGYDGCITIEREISGEEQDRDIAYAKELLESLF